ncbi:putative neuroblastoma breakpoint family member 8 [Aotus nancymaae]|uniref:putative neuroblastoma breakpoint family member 8 n=1 Tax=Aotus nancymaae TaxID=37293 RepID=UPI0030FE89DF
MRIIHKGQAIVPGSTCGAPNVSMVPSSRTCSGNTTEANFTDTLENSYSHQEETKPNIRDSKNRLLMTQVAYFLNYQLKTYRDRKDNDEEQKCRDRKNKLLMSQVGYYLGCRLKTEVPGFLCSATNISKVASGRPPSRKNTEVNVPEGFEKSCSRQEENKPNFRDSKNRLLMTQVAYFLNYQLKTYRDRKDNDEEQKCRDRKNKLLMSQVGYYLGCRLKTEVPGFLCSATNISKVASGRPPSRKNTEVNVPEGIEKSCSRQEENKPNFRDSKNRLLMTQVAYFLNYQLKTYKDRKDNDEEQKCRDRKNKLLMSQVGYYLGCRLKTEVPGFLCSAPNVSKVASGRPPSRTNTEVNVPEGIDISCSLQEDSKLNIGVSKNRLLMSHVDYSLNYQLKTCKNDKDEDEDVHVAEAEKIEESRVPREVQKVEVKKVPEDSLEECVITRSNSCGPTDSSQPHGDTNEIPFEEDNVDSALVVENESSHDVVEDALIILSESLSDDEEEEEKGPVPPRNLQESVEEEAPQESWDEGYLTLSIPPGTSAFSESYRSNLHSLEEQQVDLAVDIGKIKKDQEEEEDQGPLCPRLSTELVEAEEPEVWYSPDILYSTYTAYPEFYYICQDYTYVIFLFVDEYVRLTLDMDNRFLTMTVTRLHLVSRIGVTFPH